MDITAKIRAGRAALDWSQDVLAERSGLSAQTVRKIENGETTPQLASVERIERALSYAGVVFTADGIAQPDHTVRNLSGDNWFLDVIDDAYYELIDKNGAEILIFGGNNSVSPPDVINRIRKLRNAGIRMREMVREGDTYLMGPVSEYRWIPAAEYRNDIKVIYGDKILLDFGLTGVLIHNAAIASVERNQFNLLWSRLPELEVESTANVRY